MNDDEPIFDGNYTMEDYENAWQRLVADWALHWGTFTLEDLDEAWDVTLP